MKQTAVDFLYKFLYEMESFEGFDPYNFNQEEVFAKAKEMEKQQIIEAFEHVDFNLDDGLHYYNQTYNK